MTDLQKTGVMDTRVVHDLQRKASSLLAEAASRPGASAAALAEVRDFLVAHLRDHHQAEDDLLWPMLTAKAPELAGPFAGLSNEHEQLDAALDALVSAPVTGPDRTALVNAAIMVRDTTRAHLDHEEPVLLPALRDYVSEKEWEEFAQQVRARGSGANRHLLVGFLEQVGTPEEGATILAGISARTRAALNEQAQGTFARLIGEEPGA